MLPRHGDHEAVPRHFGNDARRSDRVTEAVAFDQGELVHREMLHRPAVDQRCIWRRIQSERGTAHPFPSCLQDVDPVDLIRF